MKIFDKIFKRNKRYSIVTLEQYGNIKFKVYNKVEEFRTYNLGGEEEALDYFLNLIEVGNIVYDVGASVGLFSVACAIKSKNLKIYAFEPDPETHKRLVENIKFNLLKNIMAFDFALSEKKSKIDLYTSGTNGFAPSLVYQKNREGASKSKIIVETNSMDNLVAMENFPVPDVLKIDIEGAEILCLKGSINVIQGKYGKRPKNIFLEIHPNFLLEFNSSTNDVKELLESNGYRIIWENNRADQIHVHYQIIDNE